MADVFIAYATQDRHRAKQFADALAQAKLSVWFDPGVPTRSTIADPITRGLSGAKCVLVLWSRHATRSMWVLKQATTGRDRGVLLPVYIERVDLPSGFNDIQTDDLSTWNGDVQAVEFQKLIDGVAHLVRATPPPRASRKARGRISSAIGKKRLTAPSEKLFLCYRRDDSEAEAGRLHDRLVAVFGEQRVFMDIDSVPLGEDFVEHVNGQIVQCKAVIVMIGKRWQTIKDKKRRRRLDNEDDLVRAEIRAALQQKIPVIPVTVQNTAMPHADDLPDDIRPLVRRNGIELSATRWKTDVERLIKELDRVMKRSGDSEKTR